MSGKIGPLSIRQKHQDVSATPAWDVERSMIGKMVDTLGLDQLGIELWDGEPAVQCKHRDFLLRICSRRAFYRLFASPSLGFGDGYAEGSIQLEGDMVRFLEAVYQGMQRHGDRAILRWPRRERRNTLSGSKQHIHSHYDLGNDFYRLWLDPEMVYTCAYYPDADTSLADAQIAKMDHVCRKLRLRPGQTVIETGCGWGALALHMARRYGAKVKAFNISHEQIVFAQQRAKDEGLDDRVRFIEDDYRNADERVDAFVSVGMLEHVGVDNYRDLGEVIHRCLKRDGMGLIHSIGRNRTQPLDRWISERIFPGAHPPTLREMMDIFEPFDFSVLDVENLRLHYARTCHDWLAGYEAHRERIEQMFDEAFFRAWRLYLAGSVAAFTAGSLQLFQVVFAHGDNNAVPMTREHLYMPSEQAVPHA
jgi:cyclopropane-fatty-acyl-phospholipid synthase